MKILSLESSSPVRSVALCDYEGCGVTVLKSAEAPSERGGRFASLVEEVLTVAGVNREEVDHLAVGVGPGSAAGIRSTLAFGLGWEVAMGVSLTGVSSHWATAMEASRQGRRGVVSVLSPGPIGKVYRSEFKLQDDGVEEIASLALVAADDESLCAALSMPSLLSHVELLKTRLPSIPQAGGDAGIIPLNPTAVGGAILVAKEVSAAFRDLEPLTLVNAEFVKAPPPRVIPNL